MTDAAPEGRQDELVKRILGSFRADRLDGAHDLAQQFLAEGLDDFSVRRVLALVDEQRGRPRKAADHLNVALELRPDDFLAWVQLNQLCINTLDPAAAVICNRRWHEQLPTLFARKLHFYRLAALFGSMRSTHGTDAAIDWAAAPFEQLGGRRAVSQSIQERGADPVRFAGSLVEDYRLQRAFDGLENGDPSTAIRALGEFLTDPTAPLDQLEQVVQDGPDAGYPVWQVINPYFYL